MTSSNPAYRPDIDGLRAIAILSVVVFHAFPTVLSGGFVGVDVFFVISSFLISSILFRNLAQGSFSFADFYARRIRRIFPALILVLAASFVIGWFILLPDEYMQLGKHMAAGAGFVQNFVLWKESGYFDTDSQLKPLLHLWSLSVEEQFYLIYPLLLWAAWRLRFNALALIGVICLASFGLNVAWVGNNATAAFYAPVTRFWELMAGAMLAYAGQFKPEALGRSASANNVLSLAGLALIAAAAFWLQKADPFPGWLALAPVLGALLLILAGPGAWVNRQILASKLAVFVGLISYPLYLWHWPLLSFVQILTSEAPTVAVRIAAVVIAFALAWLTYRFVERRIRFGQVRFGKPALLFSAAIFAGLTGAYTLQRDGLTFRHIAKMNLAPYYGKADGDRSYMVDDCHSDERIFAHCFRDTRGKAKFALTGDSHAVSLSPGVFMESTENGRWLFLGGTTDHDSTIPVISNNPIYAYVQLPTRTAVRELASNPDIDVVVLTTATRAIFRLRALDSLDELPATTFFDAAFDGLSNTVSELARAGKKVVITVDNPTLKDPNLCIPRTTGFRVLDDLIGLKKEFTPFTVRYDEHLALSKRYRELLDKLQAKYPKQLRIFDTLPDLCDMKTGICSSVMDGHLLYSYTDHISDYAAVHIAKRLVPFVEDFARSR